MSIASKALFGGALMAAGVTANAQSFNFLDSGVGGASPSFASLVDVRSGESAYAAAPDSLSISLSSANGADLSTTQSANELRIDGVWDGTGSSPYNAFAGGRLQQFFNITADAILRVTWDASSTDGFAQSFVLDNGAGTTLFSFDGLADPSTGSVDIPLVAGVEYGAVLAFDNSGFEAFFEVPGQASFISAELIPAPSSLALLGLGGLAAARRRR